MATLGSRNLTLVDVTKKLGPDDKMAPVIETLSELNPLNNHIVLTECQKGDVYTYHHRVQLPEVTERAYYQSIVGSKTDRKKFEDTCANFEAMSEMDADLVESASGSAGQMAVRADEAIGFIEAMDQNFARNFIYGDPKGIEGTGNASKKFLGLAPRFNLHSGKVAGHTSNTVVNYGATVSAADALRSMFFVGHGRATCTVIFPHGQSKYAGLSREDQGRKWKDTAEGGYNVYRETFKRVNGLAVPDPRFVGRLCNIPTADLKTEAAAKQLVANMIILANRMKMDGRAKTVCYADENVLTLLELEILARTSGGTLAWGEYAGQRVMMFRNIPIVKLDVLNVDESLVASA